ncbi:MAG: hypothetical protein AB7V26_00520 [Lysobacterales bacterium]
MNARGCDLSALGALYGPTPDETRARIREGIAIAADIANGGLADTFACDSLGVQVAGLGRELHRLRGMVTEENRHERS